MFVSRTHTNDDSVWFVEAETLPEKMLLRWDCCCWLKSFAPIAIYRLWHIPRGTGFLPAIVIVFGGRNGKIFGAPECLANHWVDMMRWQSKILKTTLRPVKVCTLHTNVTWQGGIHHFYHGEVFPSEKWTICNHFMGRNVAPVDMVQQLGILADRNWEWFHGT